MACSALSFTGAHPQQTWIPKLHFAPIRASGISCKPLLKSCQISVLRRSTKLRICASANSNSHTANAVAVPIVPSAPSPAADTAEYRKQLVESYGFQQIGKPLPDDVTLRDIITSLPKKVFEMNDAKAVATILISVTSYALGIFMIAKSPWYLLPLAWAWTGTAVTGFFVIGHDCAHKSFSRSKLVEDIVGTIAFMPLIYPYEPWRFKHDQHHAKTNMKQEVQRVLISLAAVFAFIRIGWPLIICKTGFVGWIMFWLMPWLRYHFWMSTFTIVHHTAPHIPFKDSNDWNAAQAQLNGTVHCDYPRWIELLLHDINWHIPHHISPKIPSYNLRAAQQSLDENWGKYLNKAKWNWRLMKTVMTTCHIYDEQENHISFEQVFPEDSQPIGFLRRVMPDHA